MTPDLSYDYYINRRERKRVAKIIDNFGLNFFFLLFKVKARKLFASKIGISLRSVDRFPQSRVISA